MKKEKLNGEFLYHKKLKTLTFESRDSINGYDPANFRKIYGSNVCIRVRGKKTILKLSKIFNLSVIHTAWLLEKEDTLIQLNPLVIGIALEAFEGAPEVTLNEVLGALGMGRRVKDSEEEPSTDREPILGRKPIPARKPYGRPEEPIPARKPYGRPEETLMEEAKKEGFTSFAKEATDLKEKISTDIMGIKAPEHYDNSKGSLYKVGVERGWNPYIFDIVKRLERGGKKDPLRQEIEKSIFVLKLWLDELDEN